MTAVEVGATSAEATSARRWSYLPELDGIRALAVIAVLLFHFWQGTFTGGFIGVDVFFVMSGFLITAILLAEQRSTGSIALGPFWGRRFRRLVPAVLVLVVACTVGTYLAGGWSARQFADSIGALTWTTNIIETAFGGTRLFLRNPDTVLDHLWSLAIEEQFYLVWPPLLIVMVRRVHSDRARLALTLSAIAASAAVMGRLGVFVAYFRTDARAFELLIGAGLALTGWVLPKGWSAPVAALSIAGLVAVVALAATMSDWMYPWGFLGVSVLAAALVAAASNPSAPVSAALGWGPLRALGRRSYGVYLWHIPVYRILSEAMLGISGVALLVVRLVVLAAVVEASYRFVEQPIRSGRFRPTVTQWVAAYVCVAVTLVPMGFVAAEQVRSQWDSATAPPRVGAGQARVLSYGDGVAFATAIAMQHQHRAAVWSLVDPGCPSVRAGSSPQESALTVSLRAGGKPFVITDECRHWRRRVERATSRFRPDVAVAGFGLVDSLEIRRGGRVLSGAELESTYRAAITDQVRASGARRVVLIRVADPSKLDDPRQRDAADRRVARVAYLAAFDRVVAEHPTVKVLRVDGTPTLDELVASIRRDLPVLIGTR